MPVSNEVYGAFALRKMWPPVRQQKRTSHCHLRPLAAVGDFPMHGLRGDLSELDDTHVYSCGFPLGLDTVVIII